MLYLVKPFAILLAAGSAISFAALASGRGESRHGESAGLMVQDTGQKLYEVTCVVCHKSNGLGIPDSVPPLARSEWVTGDQGKMLRIIIGGLQGEIEVQGEFFNAAMPGWGTTLNDHDIAAIASYVRRSWGNRASPITPEVVAQIRKATATRTTPWTVADLQKIGG